MTGLASLLLLIGFGNLFSHCVNSLSFVPSTSITSTITSTSTVASTTTAVPTNSHVTAHVDDLSLHNNNRRQLLKFVASTATLTLSANVNDKALAAQTAGEAVRRSAANLPGYGQPDIYYPSSFIGKWKATRSIISSDDPSLLPFNLPLVITYDMRFITVDGDDNASNNNNDGATGKVIADRAFNEASYYNAIRALLQVVQQQQQQQIPSFIQSINWSPFNPNVLNTIYDNGSSKEIKVTKRAAELDTATSAGITLISSSEYRRVTTTTGGMGIPSISASRVMAKWKGEGEGGNQIVEGIEIVYLDGTMGGDPLAPGSGIGGGGGGKPQLSSKARIKLERAE